MTVVRSQISRSALDAALAAARNIGPDTAAPLLAAPVDAGFWGRVGEVWETVERAVKESFTRGRDVAAAWIDQAVAAAERAMQELGAKARELQAVMLERIHQLLATLVDQALALVRPELHVGNQRMMLSGVQVEHKVSLSGSLKGSIVEACEVAGSGELTVVGEYTAQP